MQLPAVPPQPAQAANETSSLTSAPSNQTETSQGTGAAPGFSTILLGATAQPQSKTEPTAPSDDRSAASAADGAPQLPALTVSLAGAVLLSSLSQASNAPQMSAPDPNGSDAAHPLTLPQALQVLTTGMPTQTGQSIPTQSESHAATGSTAAAVMQAGVVLGGKIPDPVAPQMPARNGSQPVPPSVSPSQQGAVMGQPAIPTSGGPVADLKQSAENALQTMTSARPGQALRDATPQAQQSQFPQAAVQTEDPRQAVSGQVGTDKLQPVVVTADPANSHPTALQASMTVVQSKPVSSSDDSATAGHSGTVAQPVDVTVQSGARTEGQGQTQTQNSFSFSERDQTWLSQDQPHQANASITMVNSQLIAGSGTASPGADPSRSTATIPTPPPAQPVPVHVEDAAPRQSFVQSVSLELPQADLGQLRVRVMLSDQVVHAHLVTDRGDLGQMLVTRQEQLSTQLSTAGLEMGQLRVQVDRQGGYDATQQGLSHAYDDRSQQQRGQPRQPEQPSNLPVFQQRQRSALSVFA
ncbi:MAG TPA: flagellar hook-length control protein FliK [Nitrospira sp.]|nr:flagellar hook-length control protein FliK [Nitrospira sp.]